MNAFVDMAALGIGPATLLMFGVMVALLLTGMPLAFVTLLVALMVQYTTRMRWLKIVFWINFGLTCIATLYFGWHYIADDVAGVMIAFVAFWVGGIASGQKFDKHSLHSHPTTTTSAIPIDR